MLRHCVPMAALLFAAQVAWAQGQPAHLPPASSNGIFVDEPKVYDDRSLQLLLNNLKTRLAQLSGVDQASLLSKLGQLQGASASTVGFSMQANGTPLPGVTTTASQATPTTTTTTGGTTSTTPAGGGTITTVTAPTGTTTTTTTTSSTSATTTTNNQTVVSAPGSTLQTQTASPSVTSTPPAIANVPSFTLPSAFSPSAVDVLGEQMQLSYEIINLQLLLEGSLNDQYVKASRLMKQHSTVGFPISIAVPAGGAYRDAVAEVEVTVCNPPVVDDLLEAPSLMTILPREKTYNVASIVNKSVSLGASGVIAGVISVGANFLWGHQTYYVVEDQDTVAIQRPPRAGVCGKFSTKDDKGKEIDAESKPITFAWEFRPVLGQRIIKQGFRQTFAQIAFPPGPRLACAGQVTIATKWMKYDRKHGVVGEEVAGSRREQKWDIASFYPNPFVQGVTTVDNYDGSMTVTVSGHYLPGTRVRIGAGYSDESTAGFQNTGDYLRFYAPEQAVALNGASLVSRDGVEEEILRPRPGVPTVLPACTAANIPIVGKTEKPEVKAVESMGIGAVANREIAQSLTPTQFSDAQVQLKIPLTGLTDADMAKEHIEGGPYPIVVVLGGKAYGLNDAPFKSVTDAELTIVLPKDIVRTERRLVIKRLFLNGFAKSYGITSPRDFAVSSLSILSSNKEQTKYALLGAGLDGADITPKPKTAPDVTSNGTVAIFALSSGELDGLKQIVVRHGSDFPLFVSLPESKPAPTKPQLAQHDPISPGSGVIYTITGSMLDSIASIQYLGKQIPFALSLDKKSISIKLPDEMTGSAGVRILTITYTDGSVERYQVTVGKPKTN